MCSHTLTHIRHPFADSALGIRLVDIRIHKHMAFTCQTITELLLRTPHSSSVRLQRCVHKAHVFQGQPQACCHFLVSRHAPQAFRSAPHQSNTVVNRRISCRIRASSSGESPQESPQTAMSSQEAYDLLGVKEGANFEQIMSAKNKLVSKAGNDQSRKTQVHDMSFR